MKKLRLPDMLRDTTQFCFQRTATVFMFPALTELEAAIHRTAGPEIELKYQSTFS
jgi:hypothetical protein